MKYHLNQKKKRRRRRRKKGETIDDDSDYIQNNMTPPVYVPGSESVHNVGSIPTDEDEDDEEENEVLQTSLTGKKKKE